MAVSPWSFRVALSDVCVIPLTATGQRNSTTPLPPSPVNPAKRDASGSDRVTDVPTVHQFWNQFLDAPLTTSSRSSAAATPLAAPHWEAILHFCYDGMEREVPLEVCEPAAPLPHVGRAYAGPRGSLHDHQSSVNEVALQALSQHNTFFSYAIEAETPMALARSLASRYAAVHVLLRRVNAPGTAAAVDSDHISEDGADEYLRTPSPMKQLAPSIPNTDSDHLSREPSRDDAASEERTEADSRDVIVLASATVSLLDLAISEDDRFYFNIFTNAAAAPSRDVSSLYDATLSPSDRSRSRHRTQLCGQISLTLRMDEEREVEVRPRLVCLRGELPAASYQLRYGWCANTALSLGTRQKRRQASASRETSPSRPPEHHVSTERLLPGMAQPRVTFKQDQLSTLQLTCSRAALMRQFMFLEVLMTPVEDETKSQPTDSAPAPPRKSVTAEGKVGFERFIVAAHHDSDIEAAFTACCESRESDTVPSERISCEVEAVLQIAHIPNVRYALKSAAGDLQREREKQHRGNGGAVGGLAERYVVAAATGAHGGVGAGGPKSAVSSRLKLQAAMAAPPPAPPLAHRQASLDTGSTKDEVNSSGEVPHTARPTEVAALVSSDEHGYQTDSSSGIEDHLIMTPPQSLRNYREPLALSQAPFAVLSLAASPYPFSTLTPLAPSPAAADAAKASAVHHVVASAPQNALQAHGKQPVATTTIDAAEETVTVTATTTATTKREDEEDAVLLLHATRLDTDSRSGSRSSSNRGGAPSDGFNVVAHDIGDRPLRKRDGVSPSGSPNARVPPLNVLAATAHRAGQPHASPYAIDPVTSHPLYASGVSVPSVATPSFGVEAYSSGEPSVSLPPRSTPHAPSALALRKVNSLAPLFCTSAAQFDPLSKKSTDAVIQLLVSGGKGRGAAVEETEGEEDRSSPDIIASPYAVKVGKERSDEEKGEAEVREGVDKRAGETCESNNALCEPTPHSTTALSNENVHSATQALTAAAPRQEQLTQLDKLDETADTVANVEAQDGTSVRGVQPEGEGARAEKEDTGGEDAHSSSTSSRHSVKAPALPPHPPASRRPTSSTTVTRTDGSQTQRRCLSSNTSEGSARASSQLPSQLPAGPAQPQPSSEETAIMDTADATQLAGSTNNALERRTPVTNAIAAPQRDGGGLKMNLPALYNEENRSGVEALPSSQPLRSLDPDLVLHFSHLDSDSESNDVAEAERDHLNHDTVVAQLPSIPTTPESTILAPSVRRNSSVKGRGTTPRSVTSMQLSPAPPPTLAPPPPEAPPQHLLPANANSDAFSMETEQCHATALQLSAQYRTLLAVYTEKMARVRAAEARAEVVGRRQRGKHSPLRGVKEQKSSRESMHDTEGLRESEGEDAEMAAVEWLERARHDEAAAQNTVKEARQRTRALRQRLTDRQAAHHAAQAQLRSRDEALQSTEKELQELLNQLRAEQKELMQPTATPQRVPPAVAISTILTPPLTHRHSSARALQGEKTTGTAIGDEGAQHVSDWHSESSAHEEGYAVDVLTSGDLLSPPVAQSPNAGSVRILSAKADAAEIASPNTYRTPAKFLSMPTNAEKMSSVSTLHSPNPRNPAANDPVPIKTPSTSDLVLPARSPLSRNISSSTYKQARERDAVVSENTSAGALQLNHQLADVAKPATPSSAAPIPSYHRPLRYSHATSSPTPSHARSAQQDFGESAVVRYVAEQAPPLDHSSPPELLSASSLSRLEQEALLDGIDKGDRPLVMHLLHTKPQLFFANNNLLHVACAAKLPDVAIVEAVLRVRPELTQGIDAKTGNSVLHVACAARYPSEDIVKQLLIRGVSTKLRNFAGLTAFHVAVLNRADCPRHRIKDTLLTLGDSDVNERTEDGKTALHLVCENDQSLLLVQYLLLRGADVEASATIRFNTTGEELTLTPLQLSRMCRAEQVTLCMQRAASPLKPQSLASKPSTST